MPDREFWDIRDQLEEMFKKHLPSTKEHEFFRLKIDSFPNCHGTWSAKFFATLGPTSGTIKNEPTELILKKIGSIYSFAVFLMDRDTIQICINGKMHTYIRYPEFHEFGKKFIEESLEYMVKQYVPESVF